MTRTFLYAGSFDPVTNGHLEIARSAARLADHLVLAIGVQAAKTPLLSAEQRAELLRSTIVPAAEAEGCRAGVITFDGLLVDAAREAGATALVRGLRDASDLDYEMQMAGMNSALYPDLQTVLIPAPASVRPITATLVRQIAAMGGDISAFVPPAVVEMLAASLKQGR